MEWAVFRLNVPDPSLLPVTCSGLAALPCRALMSDFLPPCLASSLGGESCQSSQNVTYQRLEIMWMVCWRVLVNSVSCGSFSISVCKSTGEGAEASGPHL